MDQGTALTAAQRRVIRWWITHQAQNPHMTPAELHRSVQDCYSGRATRTYAHAYVEAIMTAEPLELDRARDKRS